MNDGIVLGRSTDSRFTIICRGIAIAFCVIAMVGAIVVLEVVERVQKIWRRK